MSQTGPTHPPAHSCLSLPRVRALRHRGGLGAGRPRVPLVVVAHRETLSARELWLLPVKHVDRECSSIDALSNAFALWRFVYVGVVCSAFRPSAQFETATAAQGPLLAVCKGVADRHLELHSNGPVTAATRTASRLGIAGDGIRTKIQVAKLLAPRPVFLKVCTCVVTSFDV